MKGSEYIARVITQLTSEEGSAQASYNGAFLTAALSVIREVESPLKEETLVKLAVMELRRGRDNLLCGRRAA